MMPWFALARWAVFRLCVTVWVPAFAGKAEERHKAPFDAKHRFPQRGKIIEAQIFPLWGKYRRSRGRGSLRP